MKKPNMAPYVETRRQIVCQKSPRPKVIKAKLEKELERYSKRIQKLASKAYQIRTMLEDLAAMELREEF